MFQKLNDNRALLMGLSSIWIAFFHATMTFSSELLDVIHDMGYIGVDIFLFISGIGACHSIQRRGRRGYLKQRASRMLPSFLPFLLVWSLFAFLGGYISLYGFIGNITFTGWWLGSEEYINWYFAAVWIYYVFAVILYRPIMEKRHPWLLLLGVTVLSFVFIRLSVSTFQPTGFARIPIFVIGMLVGRMELSGDYSEKRLRCILYPLIPVGIFISLIVRYRFYLVARKWGLWWYPYALVAPGMTLLLSEIVAFLRKWKPMNYFFKPFEVIGNASLEALMFHVGIDIIVKLCFRPTNAHWVLIVTISLVFSVIYRKLFLLVKDRVWPKLLRSASPSGQ